MQPAGEPVWIDAAEAVAIAAQSVAVFGGLASGLRDETLLRAALGRPLSKWHYDDPKPDIFTLAAAYCFALIKGHVFHDGNKRTAYIVAVVFLEMNGMICAPRQEDIVTKMFGAAAGTVSEGDLSQWFEANSRPAEG